MTATPLAHPRRRFRHDVRSVRRLTVATAGLSMLATAAVLVPSPSHAQAAPTITYTEAVAGPVTVVSSKHHQLRISSYIVKSTGDTPTLHVTVALPNGTESHTWTFGLPAGALTLNGGGSGKIKATSAQLGGFGSIALTVAASGATKTTSCQGQPVTGSRHVTISGTFLFDTKAGWGKVGSTKRKTTFSKTSTVYWGYDNTATCPVPPPPCAAYTAWSLSKSAPSGYLSLYGSTAGTRTYVSGYRTAQLSKPAGASRSDYLTQTGAKPGKLTVNADGTATMKAYAGKGSATLTSSDAGSDSSSACGTGTQTNAATYWYSSKIHQNTPPAKLPAQIYGAIEVPNTGTASMIRVKVTG